jgi:hypothetical protein
MTKVMKHASKVTLHFFEFVQLNGLWSFLESFQSDSYSGVMPGSLGRGLVSEVPWNPNPASVGVVDLALSFSMREDEVFDERGLIGVTDIAAFCGRFDCGSLASEFVSAQLKMKIQTLAVH